MHKFISIEGIEGAGKSTAIKTICELMTQQKLDCVFTREPGGTELAEEIRQVLLYPSSNEKLFPETELLLMFASRAQLINTMIKPALSMGKWVISDRFIDASYAYQGGGRGIATETIAALDHLVVGDFYPRLTLLLDLPVELGLERANQRNGTPDRIEKEKLAFFERVREVYLKRAKAAPERIKVIDASQDWEKVAQEIQKIVGSNLSP